MLQKDNLRYGLLLGFGAPFIGILLYYFFQFRLFTFKEFLQVILSQKTLLTAIVSIALVANAAIFTWFINNRRDRTAKGIFIATCIYGGGSLLWKFIS